MSKPTMLLPLEPPPSPVLTKKEACQYAHKLADKFMLALGVSSLPFDLHAALKALGIRAVPYSELASVLCETVQRVADCWQTKDGRILVYEDGTTLIAYNDCTRSPDRIPWTIAHEIAHFVLGHTAYTTVELNSLPDEIYDLMESEADAFAAELLAPKFVLYVFGLIDAASVCRACRISGEASDYVERFFQCLHGRYYPKPYEVLLCSRFLRAAAALPNGMRRRKREVS